jgi:hypothetical protein
LAKIDFNALPKERLEKMRAAGDEIRECYRVLVKAGLNVVGEVLKGQGTFYEWDHYPEGDVYDNETHAQYYYHSHRPEDGEHGHFHLFVRDDGIPEHISPIPYDPEEPWPTGDDAICHLFALAMEKRGFPIRMFTTNRWVTGENWYAGEDVIELLDHFVIDHADPSWPTNRWITAMASLFYPQACQLIRDRDRKIEEWRRKEPDEDVFEDRDLEITSITAIDVDKQIRQIDKALARK